MSSTMNNAESEPLALLCESGTNLSRGQTSINSISELQLMDKFFTLALVAVRAKINEHSSINKFPPEVLAAIFDFVRLPRWCDDTDLSEILPDGRSLVSITHVCQRWRTIALDCSSLWTGIVAYSSSAQIFVVRSHGAPVDMYAAAVGGQSSKTQKRLLGKLRLPVRSLHISIDATCQLPIFRRALKELSGSLETLTITMRMTRPNMPPLNNNGPAVLQHPHPSLSQASVSLFGGQAPALKSLTISSTNSLLPTDHFPSLTHLHLSTFRSHDYYGTTVPEHLLLLLGNTPALETFHYHPRYCSGVSMRRFHGPSVILSKMRRFCLTSWPRQYYSENSADATNILSWIVLPPAVLVTIRALTSPCQKPAALFSPRVAGASLCSALTVDENGTTVSTRGGDSTYVIHYRERINLNLFDLRYYQYRVDQELRRNPLKPAESVLGSVHLLRIQGSTSWDYRLPLYDGVVLWRLVGRMPFLTELVLRDYRREMLRNLVHLLEHDGDVVICPLLSSVVLSTLDLPRCRYKDDSGHPDQPPAAAYTRAEDTADGPVHPVLDVLFHATARRAERGYPLKRLTFCSPHTTHEYTLHNAHGVEDITVLQRDAWADYDGAAVDRRATDHWAMVRNSCPAGTVRAFLRDEYAELWEGRLNREELRSTKRHFRMHGHSRRREGN